MITSGPTVHWVGPETLVGLQVEGREVDTLAESGSQVNTVIPSYVCQHEFPMLPLHDLVDHPINLVGLGNVRTHPLSFMILRVQVKEIAGYDEDVAFLVISDESEFSRHVPIMIRPVCWGGSSTWSRRVSWTDFQPLGLWSEHLICWTSGALWWRTWAWLVMALWNMGPHHSSPTWVETWTSQSSWKRMLDWGHSKPRYWSAWSNHSLVKVPTLWWHPWGLGKLSLGDCSLCLLGCMFCTNTLGSRWAVARCPWW